MKSIVFPLQPGMKGPEVVHLQTVLQIFLDQNILIVPDAALGKELSARLKDEKAEAVYGDGTAQLVTIFQEAQGLPATGEIDAATAKAVKKCLRDLGLLDTEVEPTPAAAVLDQKYTVISQVVDAAGNPLAGLDVRLYNATPGNPHALLGQPAATDAQGLVEFRFNRTDFSADSAAGRQWPDLSFEIYRDQVRLPYALPENDNDKGVLHDFQPRPEPVLIQVARHYVIEGFVRLESGLPAQGLELRIYEQAFGGQETRMGFGVGPSTDARGFYRLVYAPGASPNLVVRIQDPNNPGNEIALSKPLYHVSAYEIINLVAPAVVKAASPEYQRLISDLAPRVGDLKNLAAAREDGERQGLTLLYQSTGWDARLIGLAAMAQRLSEASGGALAHEPLYGLLRVGLPVDSRLLAEVSPDAVEAALSKASAAGIISMSDTQANAFKAQFADFAATLRLDAPIPGAASTYNEMLKSSGLTKAEQKAFGRLFLDHAGSPDELWAKAGQAGLKPEQIETLKLQGKLAFLTGGSAPLTAQVQKAVSSSDPVDLVGKEFYRPDAWVEAINAAAGITPSPGSALGDKEVKKLNAVIPPVYTGGTAQERRDRWAEDMARKVRITYPTEVVGRMIELDKTDIFALGDARQSTAKLLNNAAIQGFRLGQTPVNAFFKDYVGATQGMKQEEWTLAQREVKKLQRVYQITPGNEAMQVLLSLGVTSAFDVMAFSEEEFTALYERKYMQMFGAAAGGAVHPMLAAGRSLTQGSAAARREQASLVYHKAGQVSSVIYNMFTIAQKIESEAPVYGLSAPSGVRQSVKQTLIKQFPTMESLFGSLDFCQCEHCRSVLSPAAYLVDLLQFIDYDEPSWDNFKDTWRENHRQRDYEADDHLKKPYDVLTARRPDLIQIPLTCENTITALPYIDLVNEILEFYVANKTLKGKTGNDTGPATSAELLAEPQNVLSSAYDSLLQARYPMTLPFDLWLETVRAFCNAFETSLPELLEVFRPNDDLFASAQPYDRAAIFAESLGLSPAERSIFTDANPLAKWSELYGFASAAEATTVAKDAQDQRVDLNSAKALSRRLGITYQELDEIVQTGFVNPELNKLAVLAKLGVSIYHVRQWLDPAAQQLYANNKSLLDRERKDLNNQEQAAYDKLTPADWQTLNEMQTFDQRRQALAVRPGLTLAQLDAVLQAVPLDNILVLADPNASCDFDQTTLQYASLRAADPIAFLRINLFVRLWRKLGWSITELDVALQTFVPRSAPFNASNLNKQPLKTALVYLTHLNRLDGLVRAGQNGRVKLVTLWGDIPTAGKQPLYESLFLSRSMLNNDDVFDHPLGDYLSVVDLQARANARAFTVQVDHVAAGQKIDPALFAAKPAAQFSYDPLLQVQSLTYQGVLDDAEKAALAALAPSHELAKLLDAVQAAGQAYTLIKGHLPALQSAAGLTAKEISLILADAGKDIETAELTLANVSTLYRYGLLARGLRLPVQDLITLKQLSGLNPFTPLHPDPLADSAAQKAIELDYPFSQTLRFAEVAAQVQESGISIEDLDYLLRHHYDENGKYRPDRPAALALLKTLADGVRAFQSAHAVPASGALLEEDTLRQKLSLALPPEVVETFMAMVNGTVEFTAVETGVASGDQLAAADYAAEPAVVSLHYSPVLQQQKLTYRGVLLPERTTALKNIYPSPVFGRLLDKIEAQARAFYEANLQKQALRAPGEAGFLDPVNFKELFAELKALVKASPGDTPRQVADKLAANEQAEAENQASLQDRRYRIAAAFLPFLQRRLIRQLILQTMTAHTGADPALVAGLLTDPRLFSQDDGAGVKQPLVDLLAGVAAPGVRVIFYASTDEKGAASAPLTLADADTALHDSQNKPVRPDGTNSAVIDGYLEVPAPGAYRFIALLGKRQARAELRFKHLARSTFSGAADKDGGEVGTGAGEYVELAPGVLYQFTLHLQNLQNDDARLLVQGETLPKDRLSQLSLYAPQALERGETAAARLAKALLLLQALALGEREVRYLVSHAADFNQLDLNSLPIERTADTLPATPPIEAATAAAETAARFGQFLRLSAYTSARRDLAGGNTDLIDLFEASEAGNLEKVYPILARLSRREETTVRAAVGALFANPAFGSEKPVQRLFAALQIIERLGISVASLLELTGILNPSSRQETRFLITRHLKEAFKARFTPETWQQVAQPIFDRLRQRQRDALVARIMFTDHFDRVEQLYETFLIDPGMEPVVQTSRIRLAIGSVQLFIQRCLLNLEKEVNPAAILNARQWEWMKRYRIWEANRKIYLFPENWLEPEFRDNKTHLYRELEGKLLKDDVSTDTAEDAFLGYLRKLEELARLEIVGMHMETKNKAADNILHVIGRTYSQPNKYFYRRYAHDMWTPWEPVSVEIQGDHLAPVVWRGRLYLFWLTFTEKPDPSGKPAEGPKANGQEKPITGLTMTDIGNSVGGIVANKFIEVQLHWSEYLKGEWNTPEAGNSSNSITLRVSYNFKPQDVFVHVSKEPYEAGEEHGVFVHMDKPIHLSFYLASRNSPPEKSFYLAPPANPYSPNEGLFNRYVSQTGDLKVTFTQRMTEHIPLYRILNNRTGDHFYTTSKKVRDNLTKKLDFLYTDEGIACDVLPPGGGIPLYEVYNPQAGLHFYTTEINERNDAIQNAGYTNDLGVACDVLPPGNKGVKIYRLYNPKGWDHLYTTSFSEQELAKTIYGYIKEGSPFNVFPASEESFANSETQTILDKLGDYTLLPTDNSILLGSQEISDLVRPFFFQDNLYTLFVEPEVVENTLTDWQGYLERLPKLDYDRQRPEQWEKIPVTPKAPWEKAQPIPLGPGTGGSRNPLDWRKKIHPAGLLKGEPRQDWLINTTTALLYDGELVGPAGRVEVTMQPASAPGTGLQGGLPGEGVTVKIHSGSGLLSGSAVVAEAISEFEKAGLNPAVGGLRVVSGSGYNPAMETEFGPDGLSR